jgi:hypothetical protein
MRPIRSTLALATWAPALLAVASCSLVLGLDDIQIDQGGGGGAHRTCASAAQCDDQNPCTTDVCSPDGLCVWTALDGVPSPEQVVGDCQTMHCVQGEPQTEPDDTDVADDHEACTVDTCNAGVPAHTAQLDGTPCGMMGVPAACTHGVCVAGDCGIGDPCPSKGPCLAIGCNAATGTCEYTPLSDGTPTPGVSQTAGDCHVRICVGGVDADVIDDSDVPVTASDCDTEVCSGGIAENPPKALDTPCTTLNGGQPGFCDGAGACAECTKDSECQGPDPNDNCRSRPCVAGACGAYPASGTAASGQFQTAGDCQKVVCDGNGGQMLVLDAPDPTNDGNLCTTDTCNGMATVHTPTNQGAQCGAMPGLVCNGTGQCGCQSDGDCTTPNTCGGGNPGTPLVCGCTKKTCAPATCGTVSDGCFGTLNCNDNVKNGAETDVDCGGGGNCATKCVNGKKCSAAADCASGFCTDGVCCDQACGGLCQACTAAKKGSGADGSCGAIKVGVDPDGECVMQAAATCGFTGNCDGAGACKLYVSGTVCVNASCTGTVLNKADTCNGSGTCVDGGTQDCAPYLCSAAACTTSCAADSNCASTAYCAGTICSAKKATGAACMGNNECVSGMCLAMKCT